MTTDSY